MNERDFEQAAALSAKFTEECVKAATGQSGPELHPRADGVHCVDCGVEIYERAKLGKVRCIDCQTDLERFMRARLIGGS